MLNLTPNSVNNLIIYSDTISNSNQTYGDYFLMVFTNTYSKQTFAVVPSVTKRNTRFVELEVELVGVTGADDPLNGQIYLYPEGNFEYMVFNTSAPTLSEEGCAFWNTDEDFWNFATTIWNECNITVIDLDRGQAFLYDPNPTQREVEFVPYELGNNLLESIVYVSGTPLYQFPCTIEDGTTFTVQQDTTTNCQTVLIETNGVLDQSATVQVLQTPHNQQNAVFIVGTNGGQLDISASTQAVPAPPYGYTTIYTVVTNGVPQLRAIDWNGTDILVGATGATGAAGPAGATGSAGAAGSSGTSGVSGSSGTSGLNGLGLPSKVIPWSGTSGWTDSTPGQNPYKTFTFSQPFANTDYTVDFYASFNQAFIGATGYTISDSDYTGAGILVYDKTPSSVTIQMYGRSVADIALYEINGYLQCVATGESNGSGLNGTNGTSGTSGSSGTSGVNGSSGVAGTSGTSGTSGSSGISIVGPTGPTGGGGGASTILIPNATLSTSGWSLSGGYYEYQYANVNITGSTVVDFTPYNASAFVVTSAQVQPYIGATGGTATFYSLYIPSSNITGDLLIIPVV